MTSEASLIYVVDDDVSVCRSLARLLRTAGYDVQTFAGARDLLERGFHTEPSCLLVDYRMPEASGFDLFEGLKANGCEVPVIFISGHGDIPMAVRAMRSGASNFLVKPFDEDALLEAVEQAIAVRRSQQDCAG